MRFAHRAQDPDFRANRGLAANIVKVNFSTAVILSTQHQTEAGLLTFPNFTTTPPLSLRRYREGGNDGIFIRLVTNTGNINRRRVAVTFPEDNYFWRPAFYRFPANLQNLGMRMRLIINEPDTANINTNG